MSGSSALAKEATSGSRLPAPGPFAALLTPPPRRHRCVRHPYGNAAGWPRHRFGCLGCGATRGYAGHAHSDNPSCSCVTQTLKAASGPPREPVELVELQLPPAVELPLSVRSTVAALWSSEAEVDRSSVTSEVLVETPSEYIAGDSVVWPTASTSAELCVPVSLQAQPGDAKSQSVYIGWHRLARLGAYRCARGMRGSSRENSRHPNLLWPSHPGRFQSESTGATPPRPSKTQGVPPDRETLIPSRYTPRHRRRGSPDGCHWRGL